MYVILVPWICCPYHPLGGLTHFCLLKTSHSDIQHIFPFNAHLFRICLTLRRLAVVFIYLI